MCRARWPGWNARSTPWPEARARGVRLFLLTAAVMVAFAANSILNRWAVGGGLIGAMPFAVIRVVAGALVLGALARAMPARRNLMPALWLSVYLVGFSLAYVALDAGVGALILFAAVALSGAPAPRPARE